MNKEKRNIVISIVSVCILISIISYVYIVNKRVISDPPVPSIETVLYKDKIHHIFFHSLILDSQLAFHGDGDRQGYQDYMITRNEFLKILPSLYERNFILINPNLLFSRNEDGTITKKDLYLPEGKKAMIISLDDLNYYKSQDNHGFANRLVLDKDGNVATEITDKNGKNIITRDGDIVPILDDFIKLHPDFSWQGMKGIIAVTGYEGVLGYRTHKKDSPTYNDDVQKVLNITKRLKETGWIFASHSYSHSFPFRHDTITLNEVVYDTNRWDEEVRPLVGDTNIFIGPFGQVFKPYDPRREYIVSKGFNLLFGVGMDLYSEYFPKYLVMNRADIDGIRLLQTPWYLKEYFNVDEVLDQTRR